MSDHDCNNEIVEIDFEVGHSSAIRSEPTTIHNPPRTHDWKVYLRSADVNGDLGCLIQRCIFHLHPEYPNCKRELKSTPFAIQETGYAGFHLPIEIYFKTKKEPKKFSIEYDLDLHKNADGHPYRQKQSYLRKYRCTFHNPDAEFRQKILAAGGKIVDSGPIISNNSETDESDLDERQRSAYEPTIRRSPQQKRSISPAPTVNITNNKKVKLEKPPNDNKKKQVQTVIKNENVSKTIVNSKKPKLVSYKSSSVIESKIFKSVPTKELNQSINVNDNCENLSSSKPHTSTKLVKSQSTNDIRASIQPKICNTKRKESVPSPTKPKLTATQQNATKKTLNKSVPNPSIKTEKKLTSIAKSPSSTTIKQEPLSQPTLANTSSNNASASTTINNLKKIPKKPLPTPSSTAVEKRSRTSTSSSSSNRNSIRDSQEQQSTLPKNQLQEKRERSSSTVNNTINRNSNLPGKTSVNKKNVIDQSSKSSQCEKSKRSSRSPDKSSLKTFKMASPQSILSPYQTQVDHSANSLALSSSSSSTRTTASSPSLLASISPSTQVFQNENNQILSSIDILNDDQCQLSNKSNSPHENILIQPVENTSHPLSRSDESDTNDSDMSIDDYNEDEDLPTSLTNDELRYKLIYIYKRFQLNSINDLIIFVRFFKRHQLVDTSTLSMNKNKNEMFTYDLFTLSPSHIVELASDLGYTTANIVNSIEQSC